MKVLLLCDVLHQMYHVVAYVMPENQFITVVVYIFLIFFLLKVGGVI